METADTIILHPTADKFDALMAFVKALKIDFEIPKTKSSISNEKAVLIGEIREAVEEMKLIRAGKKTARNAEDFLHEL